MTYNLVAPQGDNTYIRWFQWATAHFLYGYFDDSER